MTTKTSSLALLAAVVSVAGAPATARAAEATVHHVHITTSSPLEGVRWYVEHLGCQRIPDRTDAAQCGPVELMFVVQPTMGSTQGTGVNHIGFSFADLPAKMAALEKIGVRGIGRQVPAVRGRGDVPRGCRVCSSTASSSIRGGRGSSSWKTPKRSGSTTST